MDRLTYGVLYITLISPKTLQLQYRYRSIVFPFAVDIELGQNVHFLYALLSALSRFHDHCMPFINMQVLP